MTVYDDLVERLRDLSEDATLDASPPLERWEVLEVSPLRVQQVGGEDDLVLEEGDDDVEIVRDVLARRPALGDLMLVHRDETGWIVSGVIGPSSSSGGGVSPGTGDKYYEHVQSTPASTWMIPHGLGKKPSITVFDSAGTRMHGVIEHVTDDLAEVTFLYAGEPVGFSGVAYCN